MRLLPFVFVLACLASSAAAQAPKPAPPDRLQQELAKLRAKEAKARRAAVEALASFGKRADAIRPALGKVLHHDSNAEVREAAALALVAIEPSGGPATGALLAKALASDPSTEVRVTAAGALARAAELASTLHLMARAKAGAFPEPGEAPAWVKKTAVPALVAVLKTRDEPLALRLAAVAAVSRIGSAASEAKPTLRSLLQNAQLKSAAGAALARIGGADATLVRALVKSLQTALAARDRLLAVQGIIKAARMGHGVGAVDALLKALAGDEHPAIRMAVPEALVATVSSSGADALPMTRLTLGLARAARRDPEANVRRTATAALGLLRFTPSVPRDPDFWARYLERHRPPTWVRSVTAPTLAAALDDPDPRVRAVAANTLPELGALAAPHIAPLVARCGDEHAGVRKEALAAIARLAPYAANATRALRQLLASKDAETRVLAAHALVALGKPDAAATQALAGFIKADDTIQLPWGSFHTGVVWETLKRQGPKASWAVPALIARLKAVDPIYRPEIVRVLGHVGAPRLKQVLPLLTARLAKGNPLDDREAAAEALGALRSDAALAPLRKALADPKLVWIVAEALGDQGARARSVAPDLAKLLAQTTDPNVRGIIALQLGRIGGKQAAKALVSLLHQLATRKVPFSNDLTYGVLEGLAALKPCPPEPIPEIIPCLRSSYLVDSAASALGAAGRAAAPAVPALRRLLDGSDTSDQRLAARTLGQIGPPAAPAVPRLIELLTASDPVLLGDTAEALGRIGSAAHKALPALRKLAKQNPVPYVAKRVAAALTALEPPTPSKD